MPSDYIDYENNLVFSPKSADDLNKQERQSEVLVAALDKCEKLEKEIIALKKEYKAECNRADELEDSLHISWQNESKLKELLKECVEVLNDAQRNYGYDDSIIDICSPIITKIYEAVE